MRTRSPLRAVGPHQQGGDPVLQVRDLVEVLVRGGVTGQLTQAVGGGTEADHVGGVQASCPMMAAWSGSPVTIVRLASLVRHSARGRA